VPSNAASAPDNRAIASTYPSAERIGEILPETERAQLARCRDALIADGVPADKALESSLVLACLIHGEANFGLADVA
jgi:hypothetical protein